MHIHFFLVKPVTAELMCGYLSAGSPELPLKKLEFHLDSHSWEQEQTEVSLSIL